MRSVPNVHQALKGCFPCAWRSEGETLSIDPVAALTQARHDPGSIDAQADGGINPGRAAGGDQAGGESHEHEQR